MPTQILSHEVQLLQPRLKRLDSVYRTPPAVLDSRNKDVGCSDAMAISGGSYPFLKFEDRPRTTRPR